MNRKIFLDMYSLKLNEESLIEVDNRIFTYEHNE